MDYPAHRAESLAFALRSGHRDNQRRFSIGKRVLESGLCSWVWNAEKSTVLRGQDQSVNYHPRALKTLASVCAIKGSTRAPMTSLRPLRNSEVDQASETLGLAPNTV